MYGKQHLMLAVPIYVLIIRYLSYSQTLLSPFLFLFLVATMIGSLFPDIDLWLSRKIHHFRHRSVLTHSLIVPLILFSTIWYFYGFNIVGTTLDSIEYFWREKLLINADYEIIHSIVFDTGVKISQAFIIGIIAHIIGDNIKTGNLVGIPKSYEKWWYWVNGIVCIILLWFTGFFNLGWL